MYTRPLGNLDDISRSFMIICISYYNNLPKLTCNNPGLVAELFDKVGKSRSIRYKKKTTFRIVENGSSLFFLSTL